MKVTLIGPVYPYRGGIAHYTSLLAQSLIKHGHNTQVISFHRQYPSWLYPGISDQDPSENPIKVEATYILDPFYPWTWWKATRKIKAFDPDLILIQWWTTFWAIPFATMSRYLRKRGKRIIYLIHNVLPHEERSWDPWLTQKALGGGNHFILQTEPEKNRLLELIPGSQTTVFPHPIYRMFSSQKIEKDQARKLLGLQEYQPIILFFGIVRPYKGLLNLLEAIALLKEFGKNIGLVVAGEFWEDKGIYLEKIKQLRIQDHVRLVDRYIPNEEVGVYFSAADIFAAPYIGGTQSGAVRLALGFALPVVATQTITSEIINDAEIQNGNIVVVPPGDEKALANAIEAILKTPQKSPSNLNIEEDDWENLVNVLVELSKKI